MRYERYVPLFFHDEIGREDVLMGGVFFFLFSEALELFSCIYGLVEW